MLEFQYIIGFVLGFLVCQQLYDRKILKAGTTKISGGSMLIVYALEFNDPLLDKIEEVEK